MVWLSTSRDEFVAQFASISQSINTIAENGSILASRLERVVAEWEDCASSLSAEASGGNSRPIASADAIGEEGQSPFFPIQDLPGFTKYLNFLKM